MEVGELAEDELIVELEIRGLINSSQPQIVTNAHIKVLLERWRGEDFKFYTKPKSPHEAAVRRPWQEMATCQRKLWAVQHDIMESIWEGVPVEEWLPRMYSKMFHIQERIWRADRCAIFGEGLAELYMDLDFLWDMIGLLEEGRTSPIIIAESLARTVIGIDTPVDEYDEESWELGGDELREEQWQLGEGDNECGLREVEDEEEEWGILGEEEIEPWDEVEESDEEAGREDQAEDEAENKRSENPAVSDPGVSSNLGGTLRNVDTNSVQQVDRLVSELSDGISSPKKGYLIMSVGMPTKTFGSSRRNARDSQLRRYKSIWGRFRGLSCARIMTQVRAWSEWRAVRWWISTDQLLRVLDIRLEDEVLARASIRSGYDDA